MRLPKQCAGKRVVVATEFRHRIVTAQMARIGTAPSPRPCRDCILLFLACRAAGLPDCASEYIECRVTCTGPVTLPVVGATLR
jgi:hypothetical protein